LIALSVNVNKIALIRNSREGNHPDVVAHARTCIDAGADGITVHPRPDLLALVEQTQPQQCTLVPDSSDQLTSDHGFDLTRSAELLIPIISQLKALGVRISLFMDANIEQISLAQALGVERIELYTGPYAAAWHDVQRRNEIYEQYHSAAQHATKIGLGVNAGHDLNLDNLARFAQVPGLLEVSIGHALIVDAIDRGLYKAVQAYKALLRPGSPVSTSP
jgi:pyridoxine 5-phosphate synthase